jgi:hypothetical protein
MFLADSESAKAELPPVRGWACGLRVMPPDRARFEHVVGSGAAIGYRRRMASCDEFVAGYVLA